MSFPVTSITKRRLEAFIVGFIFLLTVLVISLFYLHWSLEQRKEEIPNSKILLFCIINHLISSATYKNLNLITIMILVLLPILIREVLLSLSKTLLEISFNKPFTENILKNLENNTSPKRIKLINLTPKSKLFISLHDLSLLEESYLLQEAITLRKNSELIFSIVSSFFLISPFILELLYFFQHTSDKKLSYKPSSFSIIFICLPLLLFFSPIIIYALKVTCLKISHFFSKISSVRFTKFPSNIKLQRLALFFLFINLFHLFHLSSKIADLIASFFIVWIIWILYEKSIDDIYNGKYIHISTFKSPPGAAG